MKNIILILTIFAFYPKLAISDPAEINGDVDVSNDIPSISWNLVNVSSPFYSMDNFINDEEYKIVVEEQSPYLAQNLQMSMNFSTIVNDVQFTYVSGSNFRISYYINAGTAVGQTQPIVFRIYRKVLGFWDWQTTFIYYLNTVCMWDANIPQGVYPLSAIDHEVSNDLIVSSSVFPNGGTAEFDGGASVTWLPGFRTDLSGGGVVLAVIDGCGGSYRLSSPFTNGNDQLSENNDLFLKQEENDNIKIYPNPTQNQLTIEFDKTYLNEEIKLELKDVNSKVVHSSSSYSKQKLFLDIEKLDKGIYFLNISSNYRQQIKKVIKQ